MSKGTAIQLARAAAIALALTTAPAVPAFAQAPDRAGEQAMPAQLTADELTHDQDLGIVTATGDVEVVYQDRILRARTLTYNMNQDVVSASGEVRLLHPDGAVTFADYVELSGDLANGVMENIRMLLADKQSRLTALRAVREQGYLTTLEDASYTPCDRCETDPERPYLWQVKAINVIHDQKAKRVEYKDAWLEMWGVPVAYTPYLSHPDPTVKRETGFLAPTWGGDNNLGAFVKVPYFWAIAPDRDMTISPILTTNERGVLAGQYRQNFEAADLVAEASATIDNANTFRGHVKIDANMEFDHIWRGKLAVHRASDDTYLRRYHFQAPPRYLESSGRIEGLSGRRYARLDVSTFQGQRSQDDPGLTPLILPDASYTMLTDPNPKRGDYTRIDASAVTLTRDQGLDTRRVSGKIGWHLPFTSRYGEVYKFEASLRADAYHVSDHAIAGRGTNFDGFAGRLYPLASLDWRFPMIKEGDGTQQTIEPVIVTSVSPYGMNPDKIPNEDSKDFEFDDTNLFDPNRFAGLDRVEGGPRVAYGLNGSYYDEKAGRVEAMIGQSFRFHKQAAFGVESGLEDNFSDFVGRVIAQPTGNLSGSYRFRLNKTTLAPRRSELGLKVGPPVLNLSADYVFVNQNTAQNADAEFGDREEASFSLSSDMTRYWSATVSTRHDLTNNGGPLSSSIAAVYDDECFNFTADLTRNYTYDRDIASGLVVMFRLVYKTLGEVQSSTGLGGLGG